MKNVSRKMKHQHFLPLVWANNKHSKKCFKCNNQTFVYLNTSKLNQRFKRTTLFLHMYKLTFVGWQTTLFISFSFQFQQHLTLVKNLYFKSQSIQTVKQQLLFLLLSFFSQSYVCKPFHNNIQVIFISKSSYRFQCN